MLRSRTVADAIIERFELKRLYGKELLDDARRKLDTQREISTARDGVITIRVDDHDAIRAAAMANAHADELEKLTMDLAVSEASQRRLFFEKQLKKAKDDLSVAEVSLKKFQEDSGLIKPSDQAGMTVLASASLRAQITAKEVQLAAMQSFGTTQNPDIIRTQQEVAALRSQLARIEKEPRQSPGDLIVPIGRVPETSLEFVQKYREVKYQEALFELLAKQYELARIDEAKNATLIQLFDRAIPPDRKSRPNRTLLVLLAAFAALLVMVMWVFGRELGGGTQRAGGSKVDQLWSHLFANRK
jgi:capsule polysaccharide export protein KpsE/RkpR